MKYRKVNSKRLFVEACEPRHMLALSAIGIPDAAAAAGPGTPDPSAEFARGDESMEAIVRGMLNHESALGRLPAHAIYSQDGQPLLSWRVSLLPYLGHDKLYNQFALDEPWNSPNNHPLIKQMPSIYVSSSLPSGPLVPATTPGPTETVFQVLVGDGTVFPEMDQGLHVGNIRDGLSNTVFLVESDPERAVPWTAPLDIEFDEAMPLDGLGNITDVGFRATLGDLETADVPRDIDSELWTRMVLRDDGEFVDLNQLLPPMDPAEALRKIQLALLNHESATQRFPLPAGSAAPGRQPISWRVAILPYLEQGNLFDQYRRDEPWDSPHNIALADMLPRVYRHADVALGMTNFLAMVGEDTAFPTAESTNNRGIGFGDFPDGLLHTAFVVEANADRAVPWSAPQDIEFDETMPLDGLGNISDVGFHAVFGETSVAEIPNSIDPELWRRIAIRNDGQFVDLSQIFPPLDTTQVLRELSLAMLNFESANGRFPAHAIVSGTGEPLLSWRVSILPYLGYGHLYDEFRLDEPWDSPHNRALAEMIPFHYWRPELADGDTNFLVFVGEDTIFPPTTDGRGVRVGDIDDGLSRTIMIAQADAEAAVLWTSPQDIDFDPDSPLDGVGGGSGVGFHVAFADAHVELIPADISADEFRALVIRNDGAPQPILHGWGDVKVELNPDVACIEPALLVRQTEYAVAPMENPADTAASRVRNARSARNQQDLVAALFADETDWREEPQA